MHLMHNGGIDFFYIDESHDKNIYVVTAFCIPMLRQKEGQWSITWPSFFQGIKSWRKSAKEHVLIPVSKELHGVKLASGRGNFNRGKYNFDKAKSSSVYRELLRNLDQFSPDSSIMSVAATRGKYLYGNHRLEASMYGLFQRMRTQSAKRNTQCMAFFDQGHPEYRKLYRMAQVHLPTGSMFGSWGATTTKSMPMSMFFEDANEKSSKHCLFTQVADIIAYAAFLKIKSELGNLEAWQSQYRLGTLYDEIPRKLINTAVSKNEPRDGIVRLK